jgi:TonB family protein
MRLLPLLPCLLAVQTSCAAKRVAMPMCREDLATQAADAAQHIRTPACRLPELARNAGIEGQVTVAVALDWLGRTDSTWLLRSSGNSSYDQAALEASFGAAAPRSVIDRWRRELTAVVRYRFSLNKDCLDYRDGQWFAPGVVVGTLFPETEAETPSGD